MNRLIRPSPTVCAGWTVKDITPVPGRYRYASLSISPNGKQLGVGVYYRPDNNSEWRVYGAVWNAGSKPATLTSIDPTNPVASATAEAPGDLMGSWFNPDGTLGVIWTRGDPAVDIKSPAPMVAASATATFIDIDTSPCPKRIAQN